MMQTNCRVFVTYSHQDRAYLERDSLLGFLCGLEQDGVQFWTDQKIEPGELWDEVIKAELQRADMALVLVSQAFLDSDYCHKVEIEHLLAGKKHLFPVILSPCEWRRHAWLASRQFLPSGDKTIEEHYLDNGSRKRLFLEIRELLRKRAQTFQSEVPPPKPGRIEPGNGITNPTRKYSGKAKLSFCERLGGDWSKLADLLEIPPADQARFEQGDEARGIWVWLENRMALGRLGHALTDIHRDDLVRVLETR